MYNSPSPTFEGERPQRVNGLLFGVVFAVVALLYVLGYVVRGELAQFMLASAETIPFMVLAILAYLGIDRTWAKVLALLWLALLVGTTGLVGVLLTFASIANIPVNATAAATPTFASDAGVKLAVVAVSSLVAVVIGALGLIPAVRRALSRIIPIDPDSFVHMIALVAIVGLTLLCFLPLIVLAEPPLLKLVASAAQQGTDLTGGQDDAAQLRSTVYGLVWTLPGTILAVGYAIRRNLGAALSRLGFVRPTLKQVLIGLGTAVVLVALVQGIGFGVDWLWNQMGWPRTDSETFGELLAFAFNPLGAVVIGITAGLGEELSVRGVLQPRLGILLSNLFFTSLHAFQYNWDSLLIVFFVGLMLGLLRKRTNTTTSAIAHGTYDFLLIMASVLAIPGFK